MVYGLRPSLAVFGCSILPDLCPANTVWRSMRTMPGTSAAICPHHCRIRLRIPARQADPCNEIWRTTRAGTRLCGKAGAACRQEQPAGLHHSDAVTSGKIARTRLQSITTARRKNRPRAWPRTAVQCLPARAQHPAAIRLAVEGTQEKRARRVLL